MSKNAFINKRIYEQLKKRATIAILLMLIIILPTIFFAGFYTGQANPNGSTPVFEHPASEANYLIWKEDSTYYAKNGGTGAVDYSGTSATTVTQNANDALTSGGLIYIKGFQLPSAVSLSSNVWVIEQFQGDFKFYKRQEVFGVPTKYFATNGNSLVTHGLTGPAGDYYNGRSYITYSGIDQDPYAIYYDHNKGIWSESVKVGTNPLIEDSHGSPSNIVSDDGYINVFYGCHGDIASTGDEQYIQQARSTNPEDISSWVDKGNLDGADRATYPQPRKIANGDIYVFYRRYVAGYTTAFIKSTNGGDSWSAPTDVKTGSQAYCWVGDYDSTNGRIHMTWLRLVAGPSREDVYHAYYKVSDGHMYSMAGTDLGTSITDAEADANCKVFDSGVGEEIDNTKSRIDSSGTPYIIFLHKTATEILHKSAKWTGAAWTSPTTITANAANFWAGNELFINGINDLTVYVHTNSTDDNYQALYQFDSADGGTTWKRIREVFGLTRDSAITKTNLRIVPERIINCQSELKFIFAANVAEQAGWWDYRTKVYGYGDSGFVYNLAEL